MTACTLTSINPLISIKVDISRGDHRAVATIQVQKRAPIDLLLGADLHSQLGIFVLVTDANDRAIDLVSKRQWSRVVADAPLPQQGAIDGDHVGTLKLITATRLPARHARLVKAHVEGMSPACRAVEE